MTADSESPAHWMEIAANTPYAVIPGTSGGEEGGQRRRLRGNVMNRNDAGPDVWGSKLMGACWVRLPRHAANIDEIMEVRWSDYYGAALFGDEDEIACLRRKGSRLEIVATAESSHHGVNLLLPGHVLHYKGAFCFLDRFKLPNGTRVGLWHLVGFKLRLVSDTIAPVPRGGRDSVSDASGSERKTRSVGRIDRQAHAKG